MSLSFLSEYHLCSCVVCFLIKVKHLLMKNQVSGYKCITMWSYKIPVKTNKALILYVIDLGYIFEFLR